MRKLYFLLLGCIVLLAAACSGNAVPISESIVADNPERTEVARDTLELESDSGTELDSTHNEEEFDEARETLEEAEDAQANNTTVVGDDALSESFEQSSPPTPVPTPTSTPTPTLTPTPTPVPTMVSEPVEDKRSVALQHLGSSASELIGAIGQPDSKDYAPSCNGPGEDGSLKYDGFTVYTYRENDVERVEAVE